MKTIRRNTYYTEIPFTTISAGEAVPAARLRVLSWDDIRGDAVNPAWKNQVQARREAGTSHTVSWQKAVINPYSGFATHQKTNKTSLMRYAPPLRAFGPAVPDPLQVSVSAQCIGAFRSKVQATIHEWSGPTFLGELRSTVLMLKRPSFALFRSFMRYVKRARKLRRKKNPVKQQERLNNLYLEYTLGWAPLMSDIKAAVKALSNFKKTKSDFITATSKLEIPAITTVTSSLVDVFETKTTSSAKSSFSVRCYGKIRASLIGMPGSYERMRASLGFDMREFIPTVWNLLPFSFVVDYFTNINELLLGDYSSPVTLIYSGMTKKATSETLVNTSVKRNQSPAVLKAFSGTAGSRTQETGTFSRTIGIEVLTPSLSIPGIRQTINITSLALALWPKKR